jgi:predicted transcriptional regulator
MWAIAPPFRSGKEKKTMTLCELIDSGLFQTVNRGEGLERTVERVFCCDLLSIAMGKAPAGCAWVTVMGNVNTLAVAALTDAACVVLAGGVQLDEAAAARAAQQGITVLATEQPIFEAALAIHQRLYG